MMLCNRRVSLPHGHTKPRNKGRLRQDKGHIEWLREAGPAQGAFIIRGGGGVYFESLRVKDGRYPGPPGTNRQEMRQQA